MPMKLFNYDLVKNKKKTVVFSSILIILSFIGIIFSTFYTSYKRPINLGIDFRAIKKVFLAKKSCD